MPIIACPKCGAKNRVEERGRQLQPVCGRCGARLTGGDGEAGDGKPVILTDATFQHVLGAAGDRPVLVDCWADWCGPCRMLAPTIDQLASEAAGRYVIAKLNVDDNPRTAGQFQISGIPAILIFRNGRLVDQLVGLQPKQALLARLNAHIPAGV